MTRQERRKQERINKIIKGKKVVSMGFFYKGAGITINDEAQIKDLVMNFDNALPYYQLQIAKRGQSEIDFYYSQLEQVLPILDKGIECPHQEGVIFMMNIYVMTKLGIIKDDNMNGLQYMYQG
jgi:signal transduction histidine kinase